MKAMDNQLFYKCSKCGYVHEKKKIYENFLVCSECGNHEVVPSDIRIRQLIDEDSFEERNAELSFTDPIHFPEYRDKFNTSVSKTNMKEAIITGCAKIGGFKVMLGLMDSRFMMGSMGIVVGEKIARLFEEALIDNTPVVLFSASGGARMQEGIFSLMQMAKTTAALAKFQDNGGLFISFLTHPTTGGVSASFALLGDINLSEPGTLIGFTGKRVIEQTIREKVAPNFQSAEFMLEHGYLDAIVERRNIRETIIKIIEFHSSKICYIKPEKKKMSQESLSLISDEITTKDVTCTGFDIELKIGMEDTIWNKVQQARKINRVRSLDIIQNVFEDFMEFHGDRCIGDDNSLVCGIGWFEGKQVTIIGQQKGKDEEEMKYRRFGMPMPEGYRKSLRLMRQAEKFNRPIVCFVDTPGAFPGVLAEEHGQAAAIGNNLYEMSKLRVPVISVILGEGGSGGALALGVCNYLIMLENSIFSVASPESCASILWKDAKLAPKAAQYLKLTAAEMYDFGIADFMISEKRLLSLSYDEIKSAISTALNKCSNLTKEEIVENRRSKYRRIDYRYFSSTTDAMDVEAT